jgi:DNA repair exonuclease SbcCD ATPase subunit
MAGDDYAEELSALRKELLASIESLAQELRGPIEKLGQRIDDLDRKIIIARGRDTACRLCSVEHPKHPGDPEITDAERQYHDAGHNFHHSDREK